MTRLILSIAGAALCAGCGADPFIGSYHYEESNVFTITSPMALPGMSGTASGALTIAAGTSSDYVVTIMPPAGSGGAACKLDANEGSGTTLTFAAGQTCAVSGMGATGTATLTSGAGTMTDTTLSLDLAYTVVAMSPQGTFSATTVDTDKVTRE